MDSTPDVLSPIGLIFNQPIPQGEFNWESSVDIMAQVEAIERSLHDLGRPTRRLPITRDLRRFVQDIEESGIRAAFNLCESLDEDPLFIAHPAAILEMLDIPFSGSSAATLQATTDKRLMKLVLRGAGLPTPRFMLYDGQSSKKSDTLRFPVILKPQHQDASIGIDQESVIDSPAELARALPRFFEQYGPIIVEEFIDGREFNISLLGNGRPLVLPTAEIDFSDMPSTLRNIVGYRAKWDPQSVEYQATKRIFPTLNDELASRLADMARSCYLLFGLRDYGRVDLRLNRDGAAFVLEINANPCLSPDAGFPAAAGKAGLDYCAMVAQITTYVDERTI